MALTMGTGPFGHVPSGISNVELPRRGWLYLEPSPRRIRGILDGEVVVDSPTPMLLFEHGELPRYYFPRADVRTELLEPSGEVVPSEAKGAARRLHLRLGDRLVRDAAWEHEPNGQLPDLHPYVAFYWRAMDRWWEEDAEAIGHARDPYHRVDAVPSSRRVRVSVNGQVLAETERAVVIFETALAPRWYLPRDDVRAETRPSDLQTTCAYKGHASYLTVRAGDRWIENLAWTYPEPRHDIDRVRDLVCFFNEQVDIDLDGQRQERPGGPWSAPDWWVAARAFAQTM